MKKMSRRKDDNPDIAESIEFYAHYRKYMIEILDSLITECKENVQQCLEMTQPLANVFQPPLTRMDSKDAEEASKLFSPLASKMKVIKNFLRPTTSNGRLEDLIVLAAEKDLTD